MRRALIGEVDEIKNDLLSDFLVLRKRGRRRKSTHSFISSSVDHNL